MRKTGNKSFAISAAYLVITLILCTGIIFYTNNGGTGKTFADITDTMPDTGSDEIVAGEYFAESFRDYTENASALKSQRPQTYNYINGLVNSISDKDVSDFYNAYGWYWN